ncbi:MAG: DUF998 domain-containing protein [archaeon]|nr:DUF998 domain-containing protein [archaeon]
MTGIDTRTSASKKSHSSDLNIAGSLLFIFVVQFTIVLFVAESLYPGYSISGNYLSDLGVGPTATLFNVSVFILGIAVILAAYFLYMGLHSRVFSILMGITGVGVILIAVFNESYGSLHSQLANITFLFGPILAIYAYRFERRPLNYVSVGLGIISFIAIALSQITHAAVIGVGGWERLIVYPFLLWAIGYGGYLMGSSSTISSDKVVNS